MLEKGTFENGVTGVRRGYRRQGIATALKVYQSRCAQETGARAVATSNAAGNPIDGLNLRLGFRPDAPWLRAEKALL